MPNTTASIAANTALQVSNLEATTQAFAQILLTHLKSFYRQAYRLLENQAEAEDAVQDALLAAYAHLDQFKGESEMSTWVTAIVHNCARLQVRKRRRHIDVPIDEPMGELQAGPISGQLADPRPSPEDECKHSELSARLTRFYVQLSPTLRRTFWLRDIDGLSIQETARTLKIPCGTVKAQSARARKKIKELMQRALDKASRCPASTLHRT